MSHSIQEHESSRFLPVIRSHYDWISRMPWDEVENSGMESVETAMRHWIDEYSNEFGGDGIALSEAVDPEVCGHRVLNLMGGPCQAYTRHERLSGEIYQKIYSLLISHEQSPPPVKDGVEQVRHQYRDYGSSDGIRQCILASAVQSGLNSAVAMLLRDLEPVRKSQLKKFRTSVGFDIAEDAWQESITKIVMDKVPSFRGDGILSHWVGRIVVRDIYRRIRQEKRSTGSGRTVSIDAASVDLPDRHSGDVEDAQAETHAARLAWKSVLSVLSKREQTVLHAFASGLKNQEIADLIGVVPGQATRIRTRALEKLRDGLLQSGDSGEALLPLIREFIDGRDETTTDEEAVS